MKRVYVYPALAAFLVLAIWWLWDAMHPDPVFARARTEQAERLQVDPPPIPDVAPDQDQRIAERLQSLTQLQQRLADEANDYCATHAAMPVRLADIAVPQMQGTYWIDGLELSDGAFEFHLSATDLLGAGEIRYTAVIDGECAREWRCTTADYPRIGQWLRGCTYTPSDASL